MENWVTMPYIYVFIWKSISLVIIWWLSGDVTKRLCTAAEMRFYLNSFFKSSRNANFLMPNKNCNLTSWVSGCEPGWACSVGPQQQVDLQNSKEIPSRTTTCQACCEGFFCPQGLTCMIRKYKRLPETTSAWQYKTTTKSYSIRLGWTFCSIDN